MEQFDQDPSELEQPEQTPEDLYEEDDEPQAPKLVRIRLNGKTVEVPEDVAAVIEEHEAERQKLISRMGTELGTLRKQPQEARQADPEPSPDDDLEFFQSPTKAAAKREARLREELKAEMRSEYQATQARQQYWGKFYSDNQDLVGQDDVIQFLVQKHFEELKDLSPAESQRELAAKAKTFLGRSQGGKPLPKGPAQSERPSNPTPPARTKQPEETPKRKYRGLSAELAAQAERRRRAQYNIPKDDK
jgi:hypothetical protein